MFPERQTLRIEGLVRVIALASRLCNRRKKQKLHNPGRIISVYYKNSTVAVLNICNDNVKSGKVCIRAKWLIRIEPGGAWALPDFIPLSEAFVSTPPLDGTARVIPSIKFAGTHLCTWIERGTVRVLKVSCPRTQRNFFCQGWNPGHSLRNRAH